MEIRRQIILECIQPAKHHNKFYEISILADKNFDLVYTVRCRWGRIEHFENGNPQSQDKATRVDWDSAMVTVGTVMYSKLKKGYKVVKDTATNPHKEVQSSSKSVEKRVKVQENLPEFDRTEHVEVVVSDWWRHENIEERAV